MGTPNEMVDTSCVSIITTPVPIPIKPMVLPKNKIKAYISI